MIAASSAVSPSPNLELRKERKEPASETEINANVSAHGIESTDIGKSEGLRKRGSRSGGESGNPINCPQFADTHEQTTTSIMPDSSSNSAHSRWMGLALASGACAAFNGVFAKL